MPSAGWTWISSRLASIRLACPRVEHQVRRLAELDHDLRRRAGHGLAAAEKEGHALPPPVVDVQFHRGEGRRLAARGHARLVAIAAVLAADRVARQRRPLSWAGSSGAP